MTPLLLAALAILAATFVSGMRYQQWLGQRHADRPVTVVTVFPETEALALRAEQVRTRDAVIAMLESVQVVPADRFSALPWQTVPSPARTFWVQGLVDEIQDLRVELAQTREQLVHMDWVRARHWTALKRLRAKVALMVPVTELESVEELRARSLTVARTASNRASLYASALTEIEVAAAEALSLDGMTAELEHILNAYQIGVSS